MAPDRIRHFSQRKLPGWAENGLLSIRLTGVCGCGQRPLVLNVCHAFGLPVATEVTIPGAISAALEPGERPAFTVEWGITGPGEELPGFAAKQDGPYRLRPDGLLFEKQGVAKFLCCGGAERLIVERAPGVSEEEVAAYLIATAIPGLLWMRGDVVMHGAVAVLPGERQAIAMLGASGAGKSRLLSEITEAGGSVVAEDSFRVWTKDGRWMAAGLPGLIYGRAAGASLDADREVREVPPARQRSFAEPKALVVLEMGQVDGLTPALEGGRDRPHRLHGLGAFSALMRNRHRPRVPDLLGLSAGVLPRFGALARELPVYSWEFLQAASRSPGKGGTWRVLAGLQHQGGLT